MKTESTNWYAVDINVSDNAREAVEYALMEAGALGTETRDEFVSGYFDDVPDPELIRSQLANALHIYEVESSSVQDMHCREVPNEDWLVEWKKNWQPVEVGKFVIAPPWSDSLPEDRIVIRIEPGMAFGTGTHETTRLCLAAIEKQFAGGSFLDVGTGSGILAIAAAKLFSNARIDACDTDEQALASAKENARLNGVAHQIRFRVGSIDDTAPSADFVCANLTADVIVNLIPELLGATCGRLLLSGILDSQLDHLIECFSQHAATPIDVLEDGEWRAVIY